MILTITSPMYILSYTMQTSPSLSCFSLRMVHVTKVDSLLLHRRLPSGMYFLQDDMGGVANASFIYSVLNGHAFGVPETLERPNSVPIEFAFSRAVSEGLGMMDSGRRGPL